MDQISRWVACEGVTAILRRQRIAAVNMDATGGRECASVRVSSGQIIANRIQARGEVLVSAADEVGDHGFRHVLHRISEREVRVAREVARRNDGMLNMHAVHAMEAIPCVVERLPKLPAPADRLYFECERIEASISPYLDRRTFRVLWRSDLARAR